MRLARFEDVVALAGEKRDIGLKLALERDVRLLHFEDGRIEFNTADGASPSLASARLMPLKCAESPSKTGTSTPSNPAFFSFAKIGKCSSVT